MAPCSTLPTSLPILSFTVVQVTSFLIYVFILPALTAHLPIPPSLDEVLGRTVSIILSPISSNVSAFNALVMFALKIARGDLPLCGGSRAPLHDAISAGAIAIRIPIRFISVIPEEPFGWRKLNRNIPIDADASTSTTDDNISVLYSLPWNCRFRTPPESLSLYTASNKVKSTLAILQLGYSSFQAYMQYEPLVNCQGLSSPFLIAIPHLQMSCVNLLANLVQGSYTHVTVIPPAVPANTIVPLPLDSVIIQSPAITLPPPALLLGASHLDNSTPSAQPLDGENELDLPGGTANDARRSIPPILPQDTAQQLAREFDTWLLASFPQIEFQDHIPSLSALAFLAHHSFSLIIAICWVGVLTTFKAGNSPSQIFILLSIIVDPVLHMMLALAQQMLFRRMRMRHYLGCVAVAMNIIVWLFDLIGYLFAIRILSGIYSGSAGL